VLQSRIGSLPFHPSLLFVDKIRSQYEWSTFRAGSGLILDQVGKACLGQTLWLETNILKIAAVKSFTTYFPGWRSPVRKFWLVRNVRDVAVAADSLRQPAAAFHWSPTAAARTAAPSRRLRWATAATAGRLSRLFKTDGGASLWPADYFSQVLSQSVTLYLAGNACQWQTL